MNETAEKIREYIRRNADACNDDGSMICAAYSGEEELKGDYCDRQIFELLQNADDCGEKSGRDVRVKFRFALDGDKSLLAVMNTGEPFSAEGVRSLLVPYNSAKDEGDTIGNKGLGFRSVLNWTSDIKIVTRDFTVSFSEERAKRKLERFKKTAKRDDSYNLEKIDRTAILSSCSEEDVEETDEKTAQKWLEGEYATAILLYCDKGYLEDRVQPELDELRFEELLFLKHTTEIEIDTFEGRRTIKSEKTDMPGEGCEKVAICGDVEDSVWYVWRRAPSDDDADEEGKKVKAEIVLAYNADPVVREKLRKEGHLYSYFETDIPMPFPFLVHADFVLISNRRSIRVKNAKNRFVFCKIADFMCETSLKISRAICGEDRCDYTALSALIPSGQHDEGVLKEYGFIDELYERIEKCRLLPSVNDEYLCLEDNPRYFRSRQFAEYEEDGEKRRVHFSDVLDRGTFRLLLKRCDDPIVESYLTDRIPKYGIEELCRLVNLNARKYVDDKRYMDIILLIYRVYGENVSTVPHLIEDGDGTLVEDGSSIFVGSGASFDIPGWAKIKVMSPSMREELKRRFKSDERGLATRLSAYGCREYSVDVILRELISSSAEDEERALERTRDLLRWVYGQRKRDGQSVSREALDGISVISAENKLARADECYLGDEYGYFAERRITQYIDGAQYLASKEELGLASEEDEAVKEFAHFLGLTELPRFKIVAVPEGEIFDFIDYIATRFGEKYSKMILSDGKSQRDYTRVKNWEGLSIYVSSVDNLDAILENADFYDVTNWLLKMSEDKALRNHLYEDFEVDDESCICGNSSNGTTYREISNNQIRSWFRYKLTTVAWLGFGKRRYSFSECTTAKNDFYPMICPLSLIDGKTLAERTGGQSVEEAIKLFRRLGMPTDIVDLPGQTIYNLLYELHGGDARDDSVVELYRLLCQSYTSEPNPRHVPLYDRSSYEWARTKFFKSGQILAKVDDRYEYCPVSEVYYIDSMIPYSEDILKYPVLPLPRKTGNKKVSEMFGVRTEAAADVEVKSFEPHILNAEYKREFDRQKYYVLANRMKVSGKRDLSKVMKMDVVLVESATAEIRYTLKSESMAQEVDLHPYSFVIIGARAYIEIPRETVSIDRLRVDPGFFDALTYAVSAVLNIEYDETLCHIFITSPETNEAYFMLRENMSYLISAKKEIGGADPEDLFWKAIAEAKGCDADAIKDFYKNLLPSDFDYGNLSKVENIELIKGLFRELEISASAFNAHFMFPIDFAAYNAAAFERLKIDKRDRYLYWIAMTTSLEADKTISDYKAKQRQYDNHKIDVDDPDFNAAEEFEKAFGIAPDRLPAAGNGFEEILADLAERQKMAERRDGADERDGAGDSDRHSGRASDVSGQTDYKALMTEVESKASAVYLTEFADSGDESKAPRILRRRIRRGRAYDPKIDSIRDVNGFKAEYAAYLKLKEMENDGKVKNVDWVSGNAEKAGMKSKYLVNDESGYDVSYVDSDGTTHYVDVKGSSTNAMTFNLSRNEYDKGMEKFRLGAAYDIWFVSLERSSDAYEIFVLDDFFRSDDGTGEGFLNNRRYTVKTRSFAITVKEGMKIVVMANDESEPGSDEENGLT